LLSISTVEAAVGPDARPPTRNPARVENKNGNAGYDEDEQDEKEARTLAEHYDSGYRMLPGTPQDIDKRRAALMAQRQGDRKEHRLPVVVPPNQQEIEEEIDEYDSENEEESEAAAMEAKIMPIGHEALQGQGKLGRRGMPLAAANAGDVEMDVLPGGLLALGPKLAEKMLSVFQLEGSLNPTECMVFKLLAGQNDSVIVAAFNLYLEDEGWHEFTDTVKRRVQFLMAAAEEADNDEPEDAAAAEDALEDDEDVSDEGDDDQPDNKPPQRRGAGRAGRQSDEDPEAAQLKRDIIDTLPEDIRQDLVQVSVLLSENVLNDEEAMLIWTLIQKRDPVVMAAFDVCRQTDNWHDLYDTLMRVLTNQAEDAQEQEQDSGLFSPDAPIRNPAKRGQPEAGSNEAVFRATVAGLKQKKQITAQQAAQLELLFQMHDAVLWAALEVHSIMHDTPDLEETFKILAQSQEMLQREREAKRRSLGGSDNKDEKSGAKSSPHKRKKSDAEVDFSDVLERAKNQDKRRRRDSDDVKERSVIDDVVLEEKKAEPSPAVVQKEKEWWDRFAAVFD
jgi:hypothetical protein